MKVIFLDIDGVLNSYDFYNEQEDFTTLIDEENLKVLKEIVTQSGAKIVLTSSWRNGLRPSYEECSEDMKGMLSMFHAYGLDILSKTGNDGMCRREQEIVQWMKKCKETIESFVILDDGPFDWKKKKLEQFVVKTDFKDGGLKEEHGKMAVEILNRPLSLRYRIRNWR